MVVMLRQLTKKWSLISPALLTTAPITTRSGIFSANASGLEQVSVKAFLNTHVYVWGSYGREPLCWKDWPYSLIIIGVEMCSWDIFHKQTQSSLSLYMFISSNIRWTAHWVLLYCVYQCLSRPFSSEHKSNLRCQDDTQAYLNELECKSW